jgi:uncharacterized protein YjiS (DUF1127 family)
MSQLSVLQPRRTSVGTGTGRHILSSWARTIEIWLTRQQGRQDLDALDDRLLDDIGISREDALLKAGKPFWRP